MKGFTLMEVLIVVLIIGILATVAFPQYVKSVEKARATEAVIITKAMQDAMLRHIQEFPGEIPNSRTQIADVNLRASGNWASDTCFITDHFSYDIGGENIVVNRVDNPAGCTNANPKYTITLYKELPATTALRTISCTSGDESDLTYVCKLFEL